MKKATIIFLLGMATFVIMVLIFSLTGNQGRHIDEPSNGTPQLIHIEDASKIVDDNRELKGVIRSADPDNSWGLQKDQPESADNTEEC